MPAKKAIEISKGFRYTAKECGFFSMMLDFDSLLIRSGENSSGSSEFMAIILKIFEIIVKTGDKVWQKYVGKIIIKNFNSP